MVTCVFSIVDFMILTINGGSSSIKFALYQQSKPLKKLISGTVSRIGLSDTTFINQKNGDVPPETLSLETGDFAAVVKYLAHWLQQQINTADLVAIGHRVVHGMAHTEPALITAKLLKQLKAIIPYDPDHLPSEIKLIEAFQTHYPKTLQFACFDTAFHQAMPRVAKLLPIPRKFDAMGIHRYGFHGLSYTYLLAELENVAGKPAAMGRVVMAHLGSGASLAAVHKGKEYRYQHGFYACRWHSHE